MSSRRTALAFLATAAAIVANAQVQRPDDQIIEAFNAIVDVVAERQAELQGDICARYELVDKYIGPHFDFASASLNILRREHWPDDPIEQTRFAEAFYDSLVADYGDLLIHFNSETLQVSRLEANPSSNPLWINGLLRFNDGTTADVRFRVYYSGDRWGIIDVRADSLAYSKDFRAQFLEHIYEHGFDSLIAELERKAAKRRRCSV